MDFYPILKAASMIATGAFGVIGVLTNYKNKDGRVTKWGKIAITGICFSATLSLVLYNLEARKAKKGADEAKQQYEETKEKLDIALTSSERLIKMQQTSLDRSLALESKLQETAKNLEAINSSSRSMSAKQAALLKAQRITEHRLRLGQLRSTLPLEPLTIYFEREIPMNDPMLDRYVPTLRKRLSEKPPASMHPETLIEISESEYKPDFLRDPAAFLTLMTVNARFIFTAQDGSRSNSIEFMCLDAFLFKGLEKAFVNLPRRGQPDAKINLTADLSRNLFVQKISCENLIRAGNNLVAISSLDLLERRMTWLNFSFPKLDTTSLNSFEKLLLGPLSNFSGSLPGTNMRKVALVFPYDYQTKTEARYFSIGKDQTSVPITLNSIGLNGI
jgi:hypothetical protein